MAVINGNNTIQGTFDVKRVNGVPVTSDMLGCPTGARFVNINTGIHYTNTGTEAAPTVTVIGSQT